MTMNKKNELRFTIYQYNGGGSIRNGSQRHKQTFKTFEEANAECIRLTDMMNAGEDTSKWASDYVWDGYLESVDGIFEITEKQLPSIRKLQPVPQEAEMFGRQPSHTEPFEEKEFEENLEKQNDLPSWMLD